MKRKVWLHKAIVRGTGNFPLDMLRYCQAYPTSSEDAVMIGGTFGHFARNPDEEIQISCLSINADYNLKWCNDRWKSFGWEVVSTDTPMEL